MQMRSAGSGARNDGSINSMIYVDKQTVVRVLREISLLLQIKGENAFKSRAYDVGADRIAGLNDDLAELVAQKKLQELPNIGPALSDKITELVSTGKLDYY